MKHTTFNSTLSSCGFSFSPLNPANISPDLRAVFIVRIVVNALTCPLIIVLNILVIVAVKTKRPLRTKSNIALACLSTTDLIVGLVVQPVQLTAASLLLKGEQKMFCTLTSLSNKAAFKCLLASFYHLVLLNAERYVAIKHPFVHETRVTEIRIIIASCLAWAVAIIIYSKNFLTIAILVIIQMLLVVFSVYFNVSVYKEVRRQERHIAANQVSLEAKKKLLKNKKAFYTTFIVLVVILLCSIPTRICIVAVLLSKEKIPENVSHIVIYLLTLMPVLNSLFNPLIYAVRIRHFRVAFIQLLSRKTIAQAQELERKIFGPRQIGVTAINHAEHGQSVPHRKDTWQEND